MATGTLTLFEEFADNIGKGYHNLDTGTIKFGIVNNNTVPTAALATPTWGDFSANAITTGATNPITLTGTSYDETNGDAVFIATSFTVSQNAGATASGTCWGIIYNDSDTTGPDAAIGFVELGTVDLVNGDLVVKFNNAASGSTGTVFTVSVP